MADKTVEVRVPEQGVMLTVWLGSVDEYDVLLEVISGAEVDGEIQDIQVTRLD